MKWFFKLCLVGCWLAIGFFAVMLALEISIAFILGVVVTWQKILLFLFCFLLFSGSAAVVGVLGGKT